MNFNIPTEFWNALIAFFTALNTAMVIYLTRVSKNTNVKVKDAEVKREETRQIIINKTDELQKQITDSQQAGATIPTDKKTGDKPAF